jgi:outer membrane protein assembly factor BamB
MKPKFLSLLSCAGLLLAAAPSARASDWPEFRGPTGQGLAAARSVPLEWSETNNVAWKQPIPGAGWSSPVLRDNKLYLTTALEPSPETNGKLSLRALCLDATVGTVLWGTEVFAYEVAPDIHRKNSNASPTPVVEKDRLYVHFGHHGTACLEPDGKVVWKQTRLSYAPVHGNGGSPVLWRDALVFSGDGAEAPFVAALDKRDGNVLWNVPRVTAAKKKFSFSTPLVVQVNGRDEVISPGSGAVCAYDPRDGRELWRASYGEGFSVVPRPVTGHGMIFVGTGFERPTVMAIRTGGAGDVTASHVAWTIAKGAPNTPSLLLLGEELYMLSDAGIASCLDARTGTVHWQERILGTSSSSPFAAEGRVYFQDESGLTVVLRAGTTFQKLAENALRERTLASIAVSEGALFIRGEQHLYKIAARADSVRGSNSRPDLGGARLP